MKTDYHIRICGDDGMDYYKLIDIAPIRQGKCIDTNNSIWLLNLDMVESNTGRIIDYVYVDKKSIGNSTIEFDKSNVLYSKLRPYLNKVVLPDRCGMATSEMVPLMPDLSKITREYLVYFLRSKSFVEYINSKTSGAKMPRANISDLKNILVPCPAIYQQRKIAEFLGNIQEIIDLRMQELTALDDLIKARFVEMFGDINTNTMNWTQLPLGELCTIVRGGSPRPIENYLGGDVPWIKIGDATDGESIYLKTTNEHIIQEGVKRSRLVKSGSLIFANCGVSLGFARIITFDGCIHDGWLAMENIDIRLDKVFLLQSLNQMTEHFRAIAPAGTQPNLNTAIMKSYKQILPPMELQKAFISFVQQVDKSKVVVQKALDEAQLLFDSLMQKYFG